MNHDLQRVLTNLLDAGKSPGVSYLAFDARAVLQRFHGGWADVEAQRPVDATTTFHAYSITKTFTALAVLQCAERGALDPDHPLHHYLPDAPYAAGGTTIRQLLTHTAGVPNPFPLRWMHLHDQHAAFDRDAFFDAVFARNPRTQSAPGQRFAYSNLGYVLLGRLVERVAGIPYETYIKQHVLQPLGLTPSDMAFEVVDPRRHATGYHRRFGLSYALLHLLIDMRTFAAGAHGPWRAFRTAYVHGAPYGGLVGTPDAFARYGQALLGANGVLLGNAWKHQLFSENRTAGGRATGMAMAWFTGRRSNQPFLAHAGGGGGYYAELRLYPGLGKGSVLFLNRSGMTDARLLDEIDQYSL